MNKLTILSLTSGLAILTNASCPNWNLDEAKQNIIHLQQEIARHDKAYFIDNQPIITDTNYDTLTTKLNAWQKCFGIKIDNTKLLDTIIPTDSYQKNKHYKSMGSLAKKNLTDSNIFLKKIKNSTIIAQPKIDGIAAEIIYENGILSKALTRGDGNFGMDISKLIKISPNIPQRLSNWQVNKDNKTIVIHGELFLRVDLASKDILQQYATPRQLVVALIMQKEANKQAINLIDFFPWSWVNSPEITDLASIKKLYQYGYDLPKKFTDTPTNLADINYLYDYYQQTTNFPFAMDGIVIKINNYNLRDFFGSNKLNPNWAIAIKFLTPEVTTEVVDIQYSIGRTGKITPILQLKPVKSENINISQVSVGSINNLNKLDIAINDTITLQVKGKALAVINNVLFRPKTRIKKDFNNNYDYNKFSCLTMNNLCYQQFQSRLLWLTSKKGINLPMITPKILDQLITAGIVTKLVDIVTIDQLPASMKNLRDINTKQYLTDNTPGFSQLLMGLSIPYLTEKKLQLLVSTITNPKELLATDANKLSLLLTISSAKANEMIAYINQTEIIDILLWYSTLNIPLADESC